MTTIGGDRIGLFAGFLLAATCGGVQAQQPTAATDSITTARVALGDSVFHGKAGGGTCAVCHGQDAKGTPGLAPALIKSKWLHGDGSYAFLVHLIQTGVPSPKESPAPMPPMGGANLSPEQVRAAAAYVYRLNHPAK